MTHSSYLHSCKLLKPHMETRNIYCIYRSLYVSIVLSISLYIIPWFYLSFILSIVLSTVLSVILTFCHFLNILFHLYLDLSLSFYLFIISLYISLSLFMLSLYIILSVILYISFCCSRHLSLYHSIVISILFSLLLYRSFSVYTFYLSIYHSVYQSHCISFSLYNIVIPSVSLLF